MCGSTWSILRASWAILGRLRAISGRLRVILGPSWGHPWQSWGHLGPILALVWFNLVYLGGVSGFLGSSSGHLEAILGRLVAILGHLGVILGPSWDLSRLFPGRWTPPSPPPGPLPGAVAGFLGPKKKLVKHEVFALGGLKAQEKGPKTFVRHNGFTSWRLGGARERPNNLVKH